MFIKNGLEDSLFRRIKLIILLVLMIPYLFNSTLGMSNHVYWDSDSHKDDKLLHAPLNL